MSVEMQLVDTHVHLYLPEFDTDREEVVKNAVSGGVTKLLMPNIDARSIDAMLSAVDRFKGICYPMFGLHPTSVKADFMDQLSSIETRSVQNELVAIGEIGIDLYWDTTFINEQTEAFRYQLGLSLKYNVPAVIHSRNAFPEIFSVLDEFTGKGLKGVFHAFTGDEETARMAVDRGFKLGIGGIVTFKNSGLDNVVRKIGLSHIVLETDSPYLAPVPHRGKRNESSYICIINRKIADILGMDPDVIAEATTANAVALFKL